MRTQLLRRSLLQLVTSVVDHMTGPRCQPRRMHARLDVRTGEDR